VIITKQLTYYVIITKYCTSKQNAFGNYYQASFYNYCLINYWENYKMVQNFSI